MCGICGLIYYGNNISSHVFGYQLKNIFIDLFKASTVRGTDASGIAILNDKKIYTYKNNVPATKLLEEKEMKNILSTITMGASVKAMLGHTRAQTKGSAVYNVNNHPIIAGSVVGIHNGIINNDDLIFEVNPNLERRGQVDSEVIFRLIDDYLKMGKTLVDSVKFMATRVVGSMAGAFLCSSNPRYVVLFRDSSYTGLVLRIYKSEKLIVFASTESILNVVNDYTLLRPSKLTTELELKNSIIRIDLFTGKIFKTTMIG